MLGSSPDPVSAEIGKRIREARIARGLDLFALAQRLRLTPEDLKRIEEGVRPVGSAKLLDISLATGAALTDFSPSLPQVQVQADRLTAAPDVPTINFVTHPAPPQQTADPPQAAPAKDPEPRGRPQWWIDGDGRLGARLQPAADDARPSSRVAADGLVRISRRSSGTEITWSLRHVSESAYQGVIERLEAGRWTAPILLRLHHGGWHHEVHARPEQAAARVAELRRFKDVELTDTVYLRRLDETEGAGQHALIRSGYRAWQQAGGRFGSAESGALESLLDRMLVYRGTGQGEDLVTLHAGSRSLCAGLFGADWSAEVTGRSYLCTMPGARYGAAVSGAYEEVLESGRPWFGHVRAVIELPTGEAIWVAYQRLLLRCLWGDGLPVVVCLSARTGEISIPFLGSH